MAVEPAGLVAMGLSHHTAPVDVRERFALSEDEVRTELAYLREHRLAREAMVLSTCNRVEFYAVAEHGASGRLRDHVLRRRGTTAHLAKHLYWLGGRDAVRHLFRVASSLDSLVIGEPQILGQVKDAVRLADASGALGSVLHRLTQRSLWVAKQVRTHTDIGRHTVGIGNAGVQLAQQIFGTLEGRRALLVGVGEMGREVAKAMLTTGLEELLVANRTLDKAVEVAAAFGGTPLPYDRVEDYLHRVDIVITATGATRPILGVREIQHALRQRRFAPIFLVDLAVPRNIEPRVDTLDQAYLFNVDDLIQVVDAGLAARQMASREAEAIVEHETDRFARRLADLAVNDAVGRFVRKVDTMRVVEIARTEPTLATLDDAQRARVEAMMRAFQKRVLHGPLAAIREAARDDDVAAVETLLGAWDIDLEDEAP